MQLIETLFTHENKSEAEAVLHRQAHVLTRMKMTKTHCVRLVKRAGVYQVELWKR